MIESQPTGDAKQQEPMPAASDPDKDPSRGAQFLKIEEAAGILGIGRSTAYELANAFLATEGREGLPVIKLGRSMRVPLSVLDRWSGVGSDED